MCQNSLSYHPFLIRFSANIGYFNAPTLYMVPSTTMLNRLKSDGVRTILEEKLLYVEAWSENIPLFLIPSLTMPLRSSQELEALTFLLRFGNLTYPMGSWYKE